MTHHRVAPTAMGLLLVLIGLVVGTGGVWLMALGGSWYYLPAGLLLVLTGLLLLQGNPAALPTHAALLGITLAWSLWESGLNAWALAARGDVLWLLGLVMATPWFTRGLDGPVSCLAQRGLATSLAVFAAVGVAALLQPGSPGQGGVVTRPGTLAELSGQSAEAAVARASPLPAAEPGPRTVAAQTLLSYPLARQGDCDGAMRVSTDANMHRVGLTNNQPSDCDDHLASLTDHGPLPLTPFGDWVDPAALQAVTAVLQRSAGMAWPTGERADGPTYLSLAGDASPMPASPPMRQVTGADMWGLTLLDHLACRIAFERMRFDSKFVRPMAQGLLLQAPPRAGGRELVVAGPSALMYTAQLVVVPTTAVQARNASNAMVAAVLSRPAGAMNPAIASSQRARALETSVEPVTPVAPRRTAERYAIRLQPFLSPIGLPCQTPPWFTPTDAALPEEVLPLPASPMPGVHRAGQPMAAASVEGPASL